MSLSELSGEQRRQLINAQQAYEAWHQAERAFRHEYRGSMRWRRVRGHEYLYRRLGRVEKSLGLRSAET